MNKGTRKILLLLLLVVAAAGLRLSGLGDYLTLDGLRANKDALLSWTRSHPLGAAAAYMAVYIVVIALSLPGAAVMTIAGGYLFGTAAAVLYVILGATTGAAFAFLAARYVIGSRIQHAYAGKLAAFNAELERHGPRYLLTLRLLPVFPFFVVNFAAGLTRVSLKTFVWTTALGIIPGTTAYAFAGHQLESIKRTADVLSARILLAFGLLAFLAVFPALRRSDRKKP